MAAFAVVSELALKKLTEQRVAHYAYCELACLAEPVSLNMLPLADHALSYRPMAHHYAAVAHCAEIHSATFRHRASNSSDRIQK